MSGTPTVPDPSTPSVQDADERKQTLLKCLDEHLQ